MFRRTAVCSFFRRICRAPPLPRDEISEWATIQAKRYTIQHLQPVSKSKLDGMQSAVEMRTASGFVSNHLELVHMQLYCTAGDLSSEDLL